MKIPFNKPYKAKKQINLLRQVINNNKFCGDGPFTKECHKWLENFYKTRALLTTSCTHALEMCALLCGIKPGDEIIMPSYTFVSTANAFVNFGAKIVFIDIESSSMNIDHQLIEKAITNKTKAIVVVHYAGIGCEIDKILRISKKHKLFLIEDAAQAINSDFNGKKLGTFGDFGCLSFHETKNIHCGEGGALLINNMKFFDLAEIIREKGTNRSQFYRGQVDKYRWISKGSSYLPSELNASFLLPQLKDSEKVKNRRLLLWYRYFQNLKDLKYIEIPRIKKNRSHNGHIFFIKVKNIYERKKLIEFLDKNGIQAVFHYIPLHESLRCKDYYKFSGIDRYTTVESQRILRLPMFYDLKLSHVDLISKKIYEFYN